MTDALTNEWTAPPAGASIALPLPAPIPSQNASEATGIEQARAVAEIYAAVATAQAIPRDVRRARTLMRASFESYDLASVSFYRYTRGGSRVEGPTVAFARELGRCFGNFRSGMTQLSRDDRLGRSEMMAWAWDLEQNVWRDTKFITPHRSYYGDQRELETDRDIYESNTSQAARRERSLILALLPAQYVQEARFLAKATLVRGPRDESIEDRRGGAIDAFDRLGVTQRMIEVRLGRPVDRWDGYDLAELTTLRASLARHETTVADEFPTEISLDDIPPPAVAPTGKDARDHATTTVAGQGGTEVTDPPAEGDGQGDIERPTEAELRAALTAKKLSVKAALAFVRREFPDDRFGDLAAVEAHQEAGTALADWVDQRFGDLAAVEAHQEAGTALADWVDQQ